MNEISKNRIDELAADATRKNIQIDPIFQLPYAQGWKDGYIANQKEIEDIKSSWEYEQSRANGAVEELIEVYNKLELKERECGGKSNAILEQTLEISKMQEQLDDKDITHAAELRQLKFERDLAIESALVVKATFEAKDKQIEQLKRDVYNATPPRDRFQDY